MYEIIKKNYKLGYWSKSMVRKAVSKKMLSKDEYVKIIGESYR